MQDVSALTQAPVNPRNVDPASGSAVSVTLAPGPAQLLHVPVVQSMPAGPVTCPVPEPTTVTVAG